ncbi:Protein SAWADEE HOMEODOMAIN like [Quillaja saponaria]|uniref:Protein SAWADEE HOMEODOMAIN like n=1 Tax=Quillaja saponaria TaxID=32244 RepID=A0AAD7PS52_QUISA|nr:Protein SAWADEE HOMEODOMAIN like [Quillaja saponaria]
MERLRPRNRPVFSGFTNAEIEKMEKMVKESGIQSLNQEFCRKIAQSFNRSSGRAGKPVLKWTEVKSWFQSRLQYAPKAFKIESVLLKDPPVMENEGSEMPKGENTRELSELEFEARSSKDGAWYDVDIFLAHRFLSNGEPEVLVRFVGFGAEEDEWVNVKRAVRERSVPMEHTECNKVKVGDLVLCFQERRDQAIYYDAHVLEIQRRIHDIRGCRCLFSIHYDHDNTEERVHLRRLCCRPTY